MSIEHINEKSLTEIQLEEEQKKVEAQGDVYEIVAMLYEEVEGLRAKVATLEGGVK